MSKEQASGAQTEKRLAGGYQRMLERVRSAIETAEKDTWPHLHEQIAEAKEKAVELGELTREEAEKLGGYLKRDLTDAAEFMTRTGQELRDWLSESRTGKALQDWLSFDLDVIEDRLMNMFALMVDHTREELQRLAEQARESEYLHTGEITAMGALRCTECGKEMSIHTPGNIPPCPACQGTRFSRVAD